MSQEENNETIIKRDSEGLSAESNSIERVSSVKNKINIHTFSSTNDGSIIMLSSNDYGVMKVGRSPDCYVPLKFDNDKHISKMHALMWTTKSGELLLMDMESQNGSFVNDVRIQPHVAIKINRGDIVSFSKNASYRYEVCEHEIN